MWRENFQRTKLDRVSIAASMRHVGLLQDADEWWG